MLTGKKVKLRPLIKSDLDKLNKWRNDYEVFKYLGGGYNPVSIDLQLKWIDNFIDSTGVNKRFAILDEKGIHIGLVGLYEINYVNRNCKLGIYIGEKEYWSKNYGTDAVEVIINYAFNNLNLQKIKIEVVRENDKAVKIYKSLGFREVGVYRNDRFIDGDYKDVVIMEILRDE